MKYSNCLFFSIVARWRIGGRFTYRRPRRGSPWGHFEVRKGRYRLDWRSDLPHEEMYWWRQLWFPGHIIRKTG